MTDDIHKVELPNSFEELKLLIRSELQQIEHAQQVETWAVYTRLSREDTQGYSYSLEIQPDRAEAYARDKGATEIKIYSDPYKTGRNSRRKELQKLIVDIKAGRVKSVVVHRLDRLYRNLESQLKFVRLCKKHHVQFVSVTEQIDPETWWGRLVLYVLGAMAEMYVRQTSERTREAKSERIRRGLPNGNIPLGYCNGLCSTCRDAHGPDYCPRAGGADRPDSQRGRIAVVHPIDRHVVPLVANLYLQHWSYHEIASHLNRNRFTLPDGLAVKFRPRHVFVKRDAVDEFTRDSIRALIGTPFHAGLVARYPRPALDMEDDMENPHKVKAPRPEISARQILEIQQGQHEALISVETWQRLQQIRKGKSKTPTKSSRPRNEAMLTGVAQCWECYQHDGRASPLRGSTGGKKATRYYRCATLHNRYLKKSKRTSSALSPQADSLTDDLLARHKHSSLRAEQMEAQLQAVIEKMVIPPEWYEAIMAYYLSGEGLSEFEREGHNLRASLARYRQLYLNGHIDQAEFDTQAMHIGRQLQGLKPSARTEAQEILPQLRDFPQLWTQLTNGEKRVLLKNMFQVIYFDSQGNMREAVAHAPFNELLGLN
ncbi:MAG: recombinase family protein [Anaerolineales bacterium]|nr:recombinase family protein [Anaerolineales bacterium]